MSTLPATPKTFEAKLFERIREGIGDLMTDDELRKVVEKTMNKVFFEPKIDEYGRSVKPADLEVIVRNAFHEQVHRAIKDWLNDHKDDVTKCIDATIAKGMFALLRQHLESAIASPLLQLGEQLKENGIFLR